MTVTAPVVVVLDDYFPRLETGFRIAEFTWLLEHSVVDRVATTWPLEVPLPLYAELHPEVADRVLPYDPAILEDADLAVLVFLNNAILFLPDLEASGTPFIVTLYPGGGLDLGDAVAEQKLQRLLASPLLRAVVTTQPRVTEHVRALAPELMIAEIIGVVVNPLYHFPGAGRRENYFGFGKDQLDVVFTAHKYHPSGRDKGYDVYLDMLRELRDELPIRGHVVGGFEPGDLPDDDLRDILSFHGSLTTLEYRRTMLEMDAVVTPGRPGITGPFVFDGFPTGSAIEAALCGAAIVATDAFDQNVAFRDGRDILIVPPEPGAIAARLRDTISAPGGLRVLAQAGLEVARAQYSVDTQLWGRRRLIERVLSELGAEAQVEAWAGLASSG
ncbi:MAG: glycosyltransferase [Pseudolysinimonas sp.]|uniref:glycosyltransferase n=1 Tax=Pseudolysinimonas sp. TaxID=2680009 RepID=UPI003264A1D0